MSFKDREHTRNIENTDTVKKLRDINQRDMQENTGMWDRDNESNKETYDRENMNGGNERPNYEEGRKTTKEKNKTGHIFLNLYAVLATIVAVVGIALCVRLYSENDSVGSDNQNTFSEIGATKGVGGSGGISENEYSVEEMKEIIRDYMENNKGTLEMLRELFPEDIVVYHTNRYMFIPVIEDLEKNDIDNEKIEKLDDGEIVYVENGEIVSHKGIDISKYQGDIDWKKVADSGVEFAMIRVAYRGYGTGEIVEDEKAKDNILGALDAGIKVGVYFFSQAITKEEAIEEANFTIDIIKKYNITYPVVFDTETTLSNTERAKDLTVDERTQIAIAFCEQIKKEGYTPVIYANLKWFAMSLDMSKLEDYEKWFAGYNDELYFPYKISMWQYAESGKIDGITGTVDMNISFKDWSEKTVEE